MGGLLDFLLGGRANFYPFETRIIEQVKLLLDSDAGSQLQRQIDAINKIQRLADGKEVNLYRLRHGKPAFDEELRFPNASDEVLLASVNLVHPEKHTKLKVEVWLAKGRVFSLIFSKPPKEFFSEYQLKSVHPQIIDTQIYLDPMHAGSVAVDRAVEKSALTGWLLEWQNKGQVIHLCDPLTQSERASLLDRIDAQLPSDYLELIAQTDGVILAKCIVHGLAGIRKVVWSDENLYIIAEIEERRGLAVKEGKREAMLYLVDYEDDDIRPIGTSFKNAVARLLGFP